MYQMEDRPASESESPRRSKRVKREDTGVKLEDMGLPDLEDVMQEDAKPAKASAKPKPKSRLAKATSASPRKPKAVKQTLETPHSAPLHWRETYDTIREMRAGIVAPVDTMGCDRAQLKESEPKNQRFATLVSLMLSSQTRDEVTDAAVTKLREAIGGTLCVDAMIAADDVVIEEAVGKVGFWKRKTQFLKRTAVELRDRFDYDVPKTVDELCSLPGVGPKMAFLTLQVAWNINVGIGVDVHVHRITNRLGWHNPATKGPEETRLNLQSWLPMELHPEINHMLVGFGQMICLPVGPKCGSCKLSAAGLCPSAKSGGSPKKRKVTHKVLSETSIEIVVERPPSSQ